jgi:histidine ammonia-lyase
MAPGSLFVSEETQPMTSSRHKDVVTLDGHSLTITDVVAVARCGKRVALRPQARARMAETAHWVHDVVRTGELRVYGVNTGFGYLATEVIPPQQMRQLSRNIITSHAAGVGNPVPEDVVRATMLVRANTLAKGRSGVRPQTVETLIGMLNAGVHPIIPAKGSVGASGDLAPLSHLMLVMSKPENGDDNEAESGEAIYQGHRMSGVQAMKRAGIERLILEAKEGLALNNGATFSAAMAALAVRDADNLLANAELALAMSMDAMRGFRDAYLPIVHQSGHPGQQGVAERVLRLLEGSDLVQGSEDEDPQILPPQDAYSLRCAPQVLGAVYDALDFVRGVVSREMNAATDNPLIFMELPRSNKAVSCGNFHGQAVALALDVLGMAVSQIGAIAERRIFRLTDRGLSNRLPPVLAEQAGLNSGFMMAQVTAAALASDNKTLAHPDSVDSIPTSASQEDHVSMAANAALHTREIIWNVERIVAIEMLCAAQGLDFRMAGRQYEPQRIQDGRVRYEWANVPVQHPGRGVAPAHACIRRIVPTLTTDRPLAPDIEAVAALVHNGDLADGD